MIPLLGLLCLTSCSPGRDRYPVRLAELRGHAFFFAADGLEGRLPGTPGYDSAAAYAVRALRRAGATPGWPSNGRGPRYYQPLAMVRNEVGPGTALELVVGGRSTLLPHDRRTFVLLATGRAATAARALPPVFVGNGLHAPVDGIDDLAGLDLTGRAALLTALPPAARQLPRLPEVVRGLVADAQATEARRLREIAEAGAAAILLLPDRWLAAGWNDLGAAQRRLDYEAAEPGAGANSFPAIPAALLHADLVDRLFVGRDYHPISHAGRYHTFELADVSLRLIVDVRRQPFTTANVVALVPGRDRALRHEYVVLAAHLDGPGRSTDGATGGAGGAAACAAVLEATAAIATHPPRRSVAVVLLSAEQGGRWGSRAFLAHPPLPRGDMVAAIEIGQDGWMAASGDSLLAIVAAPLLEIARTVRADSRHAPLELVDAATRADAFQGTTAAAFDEAGVPAIRLVGRGSASDNSPVDDVAHLSWRRVRAASRLAQVLIDRVANARTLGRAPPPDARTDAREQGSPAIDTPAAAPQSARVRVAPARRR